MSTIKSSASKCLPYATDLAKGAAQSAGVVALFGGNALCGVRLGRSIDPNHKPESEQDQSNADVFTAGAAVWATRRALERVDLSLSLRVGRSVPAAAAAALAASWVYQKSGPTLRDLLSMLKSFP